MRILALDSSARAASCALWEDGETLAEYCLNHKLTHSRTLLPMLDGLLELLGLGYADMDLFACTAGPGSFTGIRIGVSVVKGLSYGTGKPCASVSTLRALAANAAAFSGIVCPVMDARRSQFYNALFEARGGELGRLTEDRAIGLGQLDASSPEPEGGLLVGDGAEPCTPAEIQGKRFLIQGICVLPARLGRAVAFESGGGERYWTGLRLSPVYLRLSQAVRELCAGKYG
jgi:tRNA threonylcarbamoyladenosine biosynthesis protein TsaB